MERRLPQLRTAWLMLSVSSQAASSTLPSSSRVAISPTKSKRTISFTYSKSFLASRRLPSALPIGGLGIRPRKLRESPSQTMRSRYLLCFLAHRYPCQGAGAFLTCQTGYNPFYYDMYHEYDTLRADHLKKFGTKAYVSPSMQWRWYARMRPYFPWHD